MGHSSAFKIEQFYSFGDKYIINVLENMVLARLLLMNTIHFCDATTFRTAAICVVA